MRVTEIAVWAGLLIWLGAATLGADRINGASVTLVMVTLLLILRVVMIEHNREIRAALDRQNRENPPPLLRWRPETGPCPECRAHENEWCLPSCTLLDPKDYR